MRALPFDGALMRWAAATLLVLAILMPGNAQAAGPGDKGDDVREVQTILSSFGYTVAVDGVYGPQTTKAVRAWQKSNGLLVDGIAGPVTTNTLRTAYRGKAQQVTSTQVPSIPHYETWVDLAWCESRGRWSINTGNGYYGGLQFADSTWDANGGEQFAPRADLASAAEQMVIAENLLAATGSYRPWPQCARQLGLPR